MPQRPDGIPPLDPPGEPVDPDGTELPEPWDDDDDRNPFWWVWWFVVPFALIAITAMIWRIMQTPARTLPGM